MQLPEKNARKQSESEPSPAYQAELSSTWHALLGPQSVLSPEDEPPIDSAAQVQPQDGDPWNTLLHIQGMETVDLQKVHLHALHAENSAEIEHALNIIQEASERPAAQGKLSEQQG